MIIRRAKNVSNVSCTSALFTYEEEKVVLELAFHRNAKKVGFKRKSILIKRGTQR